MEVHHHPDLHHKPKKWKEYVLEFLMIFLAVTMGFFAESIREHFGDKEKEKQAIESLVKCLSSDTAQLSSIIYSNNLIAQNLDSFILLKNSNLTTAVNKKRFYQYGTTGFIQDWYFKTNDAAMQQLKSSGMLRLIGNQATVDSILGYELKNKITAAQEADCYFFYKESLLDFKKVSDFTHFEDTSIVDMGITPHFISFNYKNAEVLPVSDDKEKLTAVFNNASQMSTSLKGYAQYMQDQLDYAKNLIKLLNKEYDLK